MVKLRQTSMKAEDAVARLKEVVEESPDDVLSKYELCLAHYRRYLQLVREKKTTAAVELDIRNAINQLTDMAKDLKPQQRLKLLLIELDVQTRDNMDNRAAVDSLVSKAWSIARDVDNKSMLAELHYREVQIARHRMDERSLAEHVSWLVENGDGTLFQKSVLVTRATQVENELKNTSGEDRRQAVKRGIDVYRKLAKASGYNSRSIQSNRNARVAVSRLASLQEEEGDLEAAAGNLELLVKAHPSNVGYLQRYSRLLIRLKRFADAVDGWRTLARGLSKESDGWYEAKYYLMKSLTESAPETAKAPLKQFLGLYEVPAEWKPRFDDLATQLGIR